VAPLMSCSARLPVYTLLIGAAIPDVAIFGFFKLQGLTMLAMYLLGIVVALLMAWLFKKTLLKGETPCSSWNFPLTRRRCLKPSSVICGSAPGSLCAGRNRHPGHQHSSMVPGHLFPGAKRSTGVSPSNARRSRPPQPLTWRNPPAGISKATQLALLNQEEQGAKLAAALRVGWGSSLNPPSRRWVLIGKSASGIVTSFAAREVFVSTMSTVYNVGDATAPSDDTKSLARPCATKNARMVRSSIRRCWR